MTNYERVERVIHYIERHRREQPRLEALAKVAGLSKFHFHRLFSRWAGTTPKDFLKFLTSEHAKRLLLDSQDLLAVALETGLSGPGRLHDLMVTVEGVTPGEFKSKGAGLEIQCGFCETPFGLALIGSTPRGVCHLEFLADKDGGKTKALGNLQRRWGNARISRNDGSITAIAKKIFGRAKDGKPPVLLAGTTFQLKVWEALIRIPSGRVSTYGRVAAAIGRPRASRAVGAAVGSNSIAYLIPCHRVIRAAGILGGYRWGAARKKAILAWETARCGLRSA